MSADPLLRLEVDIHEGLQVVEFERGAAARGVGFPVNETLPKAIKNMRTQFHIGQACGEKRLPVPFLFSNDIENKHTLLLSVTNAPFGSFLLKHINDTLCLLFPFICLGFVEGVFSFQIFQL